MKRKIIIFSISIFGLMTIMSSCGKDYSCTCTDKETGEESSQMFYKTSERSAQESCDLLDDFDEQDCKLD